MFKSLSEFYTSDIWRDFRAYLIHERTSNDGFVHDEHNGEPIRQSYDIIAHHKQELTLQNVNDVSIALNPDNIILVSHRTHNELHARFGYAQGKKVYYVYGAPCSTKSTYVENNKGNSDLIVDIDNVWQALTGKRYYKPDALKTNAFDLYRHLLDMAKTRQGKVKSESEVAQSCPTLRYPMDCSVPGLPVHRQLPELLKLMSIEVVWEELTYWKRS